MAGGASLLADFANHVRAMYRSAGDESETNPLRQFWPLDRARDESAERKFNKSLSADDGS